MPSVSHHSPWSSFGTLIAVTASVIAASVLAIGLAVWQLRSDAIASANADSDNIAVVLADQINRMVRPVDEALIDLARHRLNREQVREMLGTARVHDELRERLAGLPHATSIVIGDADGTLVNWSLDWPPRPISFRNRVFHKEAAESGSDALNVSAPFHSRISGTHVVLFTRRITAPDGSFSGVVGMGVPIDYFRNVYDSIAPLAGRSFALVRQDGTILARFPAGPIAVGQTISDPQWFAAAARGGGFYVVPEAPDQEKRLVAVRPVAGQPLHVNIAITEGAALATWERRALWIGIGTVLAFLCCAALLSSLVRKSRRLEQTSGQLDAAINNMSYGLCMFDRDGRLILHNERYRQMYGLTREAVRPGTSLRDLLRLRSAAGTVCADPESYLAELSGAIARDTAIHVMTRLDDGRVIAVLNDPTTDGGWLSLHEDITERTQAETRIAHMARHDALTDLANRLLFRERMDDAIARLARTGKSFAVLIFDIDLFKSVNDSLGHSGGDALLESVAERLRGTAGPEDTLGRIGGDEFAVIQLCDSDPRGEAAARAEMLLNELRAPYELEGKRIVIGISIGVAIAPFDGREPSQILKNADLALYRAKGDGRGCYRFFEPAMDADAQLQREFEFQLREALVRQEFEIHYQPIVDIATCRACAVEALVRWRHPEHGLIPPDKFIPVAEEIGLIIPLGEWILESACRTGAAWPDHIRLAVNLSAVQFRSGNLVEVVRRALERSGLPAARLELEITESVLLQKDHGSLSVLHELAGLGVRIVLDDFGTGYSSLSYLQLFPFSKIKIDKSFVADLSSRADCAAIVCTVMNLAKALDMGTTAEGVETWEQLELLRATGCREAQGWLFGRPGAATALVLDAPLGSRAQAQVHVQGAADRSRVA
ncbi:EAL domain-containing protein [Rhodoplanes sp. TEM]|uniref:EAL domain-containing protein n=1 Tax=Rhodoplanes tepidamans TaxID=200616 RepID=A0ABT5J800_RHOTP|nr:MULTISPECIES: EAL domain-containing protein [Rhodoplanes]MDC7785419.1 EAL domain-containing protein [Rhodoplanes tepidamans]MDC7986952.1 EAL domain-containing protein [Rhodoplanes sp. TEM]MDQ0353128.1 diguanylate cyclase (GGDEF)-like protein [Rhodoplanes tepidamans]